MDEPPRATLVALAREYYARLRQLGGGEGLYATNGDKFTLPGGDYITFVSFDGFSVGWDEVRDTPQGRDLRNMTTEVRTRELKRAFGAFEAVANAYFEGRPVAFTVGDESSARDAMTHCPDLVEVPAYGGPTYRSFRGTLAQMRTVVVNAGVKFDSGRILEIPSAEGLYFSGDDLTRRRTGPTTYTLRFGLTGTEAEIARYAGLLDRVLGRTR